VVDDQRQVCHVERARAERELLAGAERDAVPDPLAGHGQDLRPRVDAVRRQGDTAPGEPPSERSRDVRGAGADVEQAHRRGRAGTCQQPHQRHA
jgi:hypothetical protein